MAICYRSPDFNFRSDDGVEVESRPIGVYRDENDAATSTCPVDGQGWRLASAGRVDDGVRADAVVEVAKGLPGIDLLRVNGGVCAQLLGEVEAHLPPVDGEYAETVGFGYLYGQYPNGPGAQDRQSVAGPELASSDGVVGYGRRLDKGGFLTADVVGKPDGGRRVPDHILGQSAVQRKARHGHGGALVGPLADASVAGAAG